MSRTQRQGETWMFCGFHLKIFQDNTVIIYISTCSPNEWELFSCHSRWLNYKTPTDHIAQCRQNETNPEHIFKISERRDKYFLLLALSRHGKNNRHRDCAMKVDRKFLICIILMIDRRPESVERTKRNQTKIYILPCRTNYLWNFQQLGKNIQRWSISKICLSQ